MTAPRMAPEGQGGRRRKPGSGTKLRSAKRCPGCGHKTTQPCRICDIRTKIRQEQLAAKLRAEGMT